ncbi:MAG: 2-dehydropantoate 2-reductase [Paracoccaceae bacterium]|nr:2-dehydropantoate 2-reductase [Paracoccaceae bacterium]
MSDATLIWGAGAIGGSLGAAFLRAGQKVVFVDRVADHVAAIRTRGLRIEGPIFEDTVAAPAFLPEDLTGTYRNIYLCVKAQHTAGAIRTLAPFVAPDGHVISAQNGLNERVIAAEIGADRTIGCFVNFGADYLEPGVVHYSGRGAVVVGELDGSIGPRVQAIWNQLKTFEPNAVVTDNIWGYLWGKLIYGALLFGTAVTNDSIADVLDDPHSRPVLTALALEVGRIAAAEGIALQGFDGFDPSAFTPTATAAETARSFDLMVAHNRRSLKSHSGIWRDLAVRMRPTEVDAQLGPIVEAGKSRGLPCRITARLIELIHEIERAERPLAKANIDELAAVAAREAKA